MHLLFPSGCQRCVKNSKDASLNTFEESTIPDESVYGYHRKCYQEYTHTQTKALTNGGKYTSCSRTEKKW